MARSNKRPDQQQPSSAGGNNFNWTTLKFQFKHVIFPTLLMSLFPFLGVVLAVHAQNGDLSTFRLSHFLGNRFTWTSVLVLSAWAFAFQKFTSKVYHGPTTNFGYTPKYAANGFAYYAATLVAFVTVNLVSPTLSTTIVQDVPLLIGNLMSVAFIVCLYLWYKGKRRPSSNEKLESRPAIFEFYRGIELHPRIFNTVDVKQLLVSRISLILWQLLIVAFLVAGYERNGLNAGHVVNVLLQTCYLAKFYYWETGYFNTLDITLDRAGFYLCWGCLGFLPIGYTYSTYYFVYHPPTVSATSAALLFLVGLAAIGLNYEVDRQKQVFRSTDGKCKIFGRDPLFTVVQYRSANGDLKNSKLLLSGFWGTARHLNYLFELSAALIWNLPGYNLGPLPFLYNVFLFVLLVHRIFRDEHKCEDKYGAAWKKYCKAVPYRLVPYVF